MQQASRIWGISKEIFWEMDSGVRLRSQTKASLNRYSWNNQLGGDICSRLSTLFPSRQTMHSLQIFDTSTWRPLALALRLVVTLLDTDSKRSKCHSEVFTHEEVTRTLKSVRKNIDNIKANEPFNLFLYYFLTCSVFKDQYL